MGTLNSQKRENPTVADALADQLKQMTTQDLQQIMSALPLEIRGRQDAFLGSAQDVSAALQTLLKEGALRTNIPKLSAFSGEMAKGRYPFSSGAMSSKHSASHTVIQP